MMTSRIRISHTPAYRFLSPISLIKPYVWPGPCQKTSQKRPGPKKKPRLRNKHACKWVFEKAIRGKLYNANKI